MTLERSFSQTTFTTNNLITTTFADRPYRTVPNTPTPVSPAQVKTRFHAPLNKTNSDHSILSRKSTPEITSSTVWVSSDDVQLRKGESRLSAKSSARRQLSLQYTGSAQHGFPSKGARRSSYPHVLQFDRRVSVSNASNSEPKEGSSNLNTSSATQSTERSSKPSAGKSSVSLEGGRRTPREVTLEFPPMPRSGNSQSSVAKKWEKSKVKKSSGLKPAQSMPGLAEQSDKESRAHSADARPRQSTTCALFFIFRRKKKSKEDRSPSPGARHQDSLKTGYSTPTPDRQSGPPDKERRPSQTSSNKERRPSQTSSTRDRHTAQHAPSRQPQTPTSHVQSPTTTTAETERTPHYETRSRQRHRKEKREHGHTPGSRSRSDPRSRSDHRHLRHEDLPPHPSILKSSAEKTNSAPHTSVYLKNSFAKTEGKSKTTSRSTPDKIKSRSKSPTKSQALKDNRPKSQASTSAEKAAQLELRKNSDNLQRDLKAGGSGDNYESIWIAENHVANSDHDLVEEAVSSLMIVTVESEEKPPLDSEKEAAGSEEKLPFEDDCESSEEEADVKTASDSRADSAQKISLSKSRADSRSDSALLKNDSRSDSALHHKNDSRSDSALHKKASGTTSSGSNLKSSESVCGSAPNLGAKSLVSTSKTDPETESQHQPAVSSSDRHSVRSRSLPKFNPHCQPDADVKVISDAEDFEFKPTDMKGPLNLSLCGCGFLGMYHLGVVSCLAQRAPSLMERVEKVGGASAGALMAAVLVTSKDKMEESAEHVQNLAKEIRKKPLGALTPGYSFTRSLRYMLDDILPEDAHETAKGKLFVSLTNAQTKKNEMMSDYKSREELIEALVASCYIPVYAGMKLPTIRGKKYMDGGLSDNMPRFESGRTITVSPFDGKSDIGPKMGQEVEKKAHFINFHNQEYQVNMSNFKRGKDAFFPPKPHVLQEYFEKGRYDASRFLIREGLYEIALQQQTKQVLYESSV